MNHPLPFRVGVSSAVHILTVVIGHHAPHGWVVQVHVKVRGYLPPILDVKKGQSDIEGLHLERK